jgi:hypothetical protein
MKISQMSDLTTKLGLGAVIASGGYVAKLLIQEWTNWRHKREIRHARLLQLRSLLNAARYAYNIQLQHRNALAERLQARNPTDRRTLAAEGYEQLFATHFETFTPAESELHALIRGLTVHGLRPNNSAIGKWLADDSDFRVQSAGKGTRGELADKLNLLANHLLSWDAKYEMWIPNHPEHALVYLADEKRHGVGFPRGIEDLVQNALEEF